MEKKDNSGKQNAKFLGDFKGEIPEHAHTDGILSVKGSDIVSEDGSKLVTGHHWNILSGNNIQNLRRFVACWNFCAGFHIEQIESSSLEIQMKKMRQLSGELGKAWGNQNPTPTGLATDRDLALMVLKDLIFAARTSGGTAGPDESLMNACEAAEIAYNKIQSPAYFIATENGIEDLDGEPPIEIEDRSEHISEVSKRIIAELDKKHGTQN